MAATSHIFTSDLWTSESLARWVFVSLPQELSDEIRDVPRVERPGFGSLRVAVTLGCSTWTTSIFPEKNSGPYVLPVKKAVRVAEGIDLGDVVEISLELLD